MRSQVKYLILLFVLAAKSVFAQDYDENVINSIDSIFINVYDHKHRAEYDKAVTSLQSALLLAKTASDSVRIAKSYNIFADLYIDRDRHTDAIAFLDKAEEIQKLSGDKIGHATTLTSRGLAAVKQKEFRKAVNYFDEAEAIFETNKTFESFNKVSMSKGILYMELGEYEEAIVKLENSLPIVDPYEGNFLRSKVLLLLSEANKKLGKNVDANIDALNALNIAKSYDFPELMMQSYNLLYEISEDTNQLSDAIYYLKQHNKMRDSVFSTDRLVKIKEATAQFDSEFKENLIQEMSRNSDELNQTVKISKLTSILSSALLIIISLLTISLYRNNQIKIKTNQLLVKKNNELQIAKEKAEKAMQAKAQFLSTVSHELRTPLYAVTGLTHLLLEENPSKHQEEHLKSLKFSGDYLLAFINDILQINKIEAKKLSVKKDDLNLAKILQDVVNSLSTTAKENNNKIHLELDERIPMYIIGDPLKLSQIFINLVGNSLKFTENGDVRIIVNVEEELESSIRLHFAVKDNGIGISEEMQATIFDSFAQGSIQINRKYGGTGLGLTIVKSLLELLESEIQLESTLGEGTTFSFAVDFEKSKKVQSRIKKKVLAAGPDLFSKLKILLVEDNKINQVITKKMLNKKGMSCDIANDGYEAIDLAKKNEYDLILMDIHMPGISGLKATEEIRKFNDIIPIIALTAISLDENTDDFYQAGCNDVVTKPFKPDIFYKKISESVTGSLQKS